MSSRHPVLLFSRQVSAALSGYLTAVQDTEDAVKRELQMLSDSLVQSNDLPVIAQVALRVLRIFFLGSAGYASSRVSRLFAGFNTEFCGILRFSGFCGFYGHYRYCGHGKFRGFLVLVSRFFRVYGFAGLGMVVYAGVTGFLSVTPRCFQSGSAELERISSLVAWRSVWRSTILIGRCFCAGCSLVSDLPGDGGPRATRVVVRVVAPVAQGPRTAGHEHAGERRW